MDDEIMGITNYMELAAQQALKIAQLEEQNKEMREVFRSIKMSLICIGGPLNNNVRQYSKDQLVPFYQIDFQISDEWTRDGN